MADFPGEAKLETVLAGFGRASRLAVRAAILIRLRDVTQAIESESRETERQDWAILPAFAG